MTNATMNKQPTLAAWLVRCIVACSIASALPLGATLVARALGWFSPAPDADLFPTCVAMSLFAGFALAYNMGALKREG